MLTLLAWLLAIITAPFWIPALLLIIGVIILILGIFLLCFLGLNLCFIIGILKTLYNVHIGIVDARRAVLAEIGKGISWWRLLRLSISRYKKQIRDAREFYK